MEKNTVAISLKIVKMSDEESMLIPNSPIWGKHIENVIKTDDCEYSCLDGKDISENDLVCSFFIDKQGVLKLYNTDDIDEAMSKYFDILKEISIIYSYNKQSARNEVTYVIKDENNKPVILDDDGVKSYIYQKIAENTNMAPSVETNDSENQLFDVPTLCEAIKSEVIGQEEAIEEVVISLALHYLSEAPIFKSNVLVNGPVGSGKTEIFKSLVRHIDIPVTIDSATEYSLGSLPLDYFLLKVLENCDKDIEKAEGSIIVLDDLDKKVLSDDVEESKYFIDEINKLMNGKIYHFTVGDNSIGLNTKNMAFFGIGDYKARQMNVMKKVGYGPCSSECEGIPEQLSRQASSIITTNSLTIDSVKDSVINSRISELYAYAKILKNVNVDLGFTEEFVNEIATRVMERNRGLYPMRNIIRDCFKDAIKDVLMNPGKFTKLTVTQEILDDSKKYVLK